MTKTALTDMTDEEIIKSLIREALSGPAFSAAPVMRAIRLLRLSDTSLDAQRVQALDGVDFQNMSDWLIEQLPKLIDRAVTTSTGPSILAACAVDELTRSSDGASGTLGDVSGTPGYVGRISTK